MKFKQIGSDIAVLTELTSAAEALIRRGEWSTIPLGGAIVVGNHLV